MNDPPQPAGRAYARLVAVSIGTAVGLAAVGYYPTLRLAGRVLAEMVAAIGVSLVAGWVGAAPIARAVRNPDPRQMPVAILLATALRFLIVLSLTVVGVFSGWFERVPFVLWVGISYLVMLFVDSVYAVRMVGAARQQQA